MQTRPAHAIGRVREEHADDPHAASVAVTVGARAFAGIAGALAAQLGATVHPASAGRVHGGSINECHRLESGGGPLFLKLADADRREMLEAEAEGLRELAAARAVRVPQVRALGEAAGSAYLALEWIDFAAGTPAADARLGEQLARQHRLIAQRFGWRRDNTIGSTPQRNAWADDWVAFLRERRLGFQLELARSRGHRGRLQARGAELLERIGRFFESYRPVPSLLHGDLWGGNRAADERGSPVIFDPAVYYGDREADIAMTRLFGGFGAGFYAAYEAAWPLDPGAPQRIALYNLYHVLNHLNLFGASYARQAEEMIDLLLAELGH
jgi:protein-ribulosamine 3-kinase